MSAPTTRGKVEYCLFDMDGLLSGSAMSIRLTLLTDQCKL